MVEQGDPSGIEFPPRPVQSSNARVAVAVVVTIVAVGGAVALIVARPGAGGPSPSPIPRASAAALATERPSTGSSLPSLDVAIWVDFTSARNGISAKFPPAWAVTAALGDSYYTRQGYPAPRIGQLHDPGPTQGALDSAISTDGMAFFISSLWIPAGMSEAAWWDDYAGADVCAGCTPGRVPGPSAACFPKLPSDFKHVTVDGQQGYEHGGLPSCNFTEVVVLVGGRAYQLTAYVNVYHVTGQVFDQALFTAWLSTIHFDPATADDTPLASPTPS